MSVNRHAYNDNGRRWRIVDFGTGVKVVPRQAQAATSGEVAAAADTRPAPLAKPLAALADNGGDQRHAAGAAG